MTGGCTLKNLLTEIFPGFYHFHLTIKSTGDLPLCHIPSFVHRAQTLLLSLPVPTVSVSSQGELKITVGGGVLSGT